jgi:hypothetical protein
MVLFWWIFTQYRRFASGNVKSSINILLGKIQNQIQAFKNKIIIIVFCRKCGKNINNKIK